MSDSLSPRTKIINELLQELKSVGEKEVEKLILYFYSSGKATIGEIAEVLGCSRKTLYQKYPSLTKVNKGENHDE